MTLWRRRNTEKQQGFDDIVYVEMIFTVSRYQLQVESFRRYHTQLPGNSTQMWFSSPCFRQFRRSTAARRQALHPV